MRKYFIYCSLGLFSIGWLTGCGLVRSIRGDDDSGSHRVGMLQRQRWPGGEAAPGSLGTVSTVNAPDAVVGQESVVILSSRRSETIVQAKSASPSAGVAKAPAPLPKVFTNPELPLAEKIEIMTIPDTFAPALPAANMLPAPANQVQADVVVMPASRSLETEPTDGRDKAIALKSVHIQYGHAEQFASITGQVQEYRKTFRLRYAAVDQEDAYGGVVVLDGADLGRLSDGKHVRVRGELIAPTDRNGMARYRVSAIEVLD
jgi:hypothetical protein